MLIDVSKIPRHVAIIMDGNGRWANTRGECRSVGHREGSRAVRRTVTVCRRLGVEALTLYAFSEQNWSRPQLEVDALMGLLRDYLVSERDEVLEKQIRVRAVGDLSRLPASVRDVLDPLVDETETFRGMHLNLALSYGGREEITSAAKHLAELASRGELDPANIDMKSLEAHMPSMARGAVDLLIRSGGEKRISNFLLWGAAYAELFFTDKLWPDFDEADLYSAFAWYQDRERRFGLTSAQVTAPSSEPPHVAILPTGLPTGPPTGGRKGLAVAE